MLAECGRNTWIINQSDITITDRGQNNPEWHITRECRAYSSRQDHIYSLSPTWVDPFFFVSTSGYAGRHKIVQRPLWRFCPTRIAGGGDKSRVDFLEPCILKLFVNFSAVISCCKYATAKRRLKKFVWRLKNFVVFETTSGIYHTARGRDRNLG